MVLVILPRFFGFSTSTKNGLPDCSVNTTISKRTG
jgi:hypothetical protein